MKSNALKPRSPSCTVNFDAVGKQNGAIHVPTATASSALGSIQIPLTMLSNGNGPTVVIMAGEACSEYNGALAIQQLARDIDVNQVNGRLILIPSINPHYRHNAISEPRSHHFAQDDAQTQTSTYLAEHIFSIADAVIELKSGDTTSHYASSVAIHQNPANSALQSTAEACMIAFGAPFSVRLLPSSVGSLAHTVESLDIPFITTRLGGGGCASYAMINQALICCKNVLLHLNALNTEFVLCATQMLEISHDDQFLLSPTNGLLQPCKEVGEEVFRGNPIAHVVDPSSCGAAVQTINANRNGVLLARHHSGLVNAGDCIALLADEVQR